MCSGTAKSEAAIYNLVGEYICVYVSCVLCCMTSNSTWLEPGSLQERRKVGILIPHLLDVHACMRIIHLPALGLTACLLLHSLHSTWGDNAPVSPTVANNLRRFALPMHLVPRISSQLILFILIS